MKVLRVIVVALGLLAVGCGGSKGASGKTPGTTHSGTSGAATGDDVEDGLGGPDAGVLDAAGPPSPVTFILKNSSDEALALNMDKGWQPILFAYSGQPPNAKSILMFPTHCTASCDTPQEDRCPLCPEPEKVEDIKQAQTLELIEPGASKEVPWDGLHFKYERTKGKGRTKCKCYTTEPAPAETYTVKACGLRLTKTEKASSRYQCVESQMTLPVEAPIRVELDFGK